jgi:hypothetical protein
MRMKRGKAMADYLWLILFVVFWILLQTVILPKFGVQT